MLELLCSHYTTHIKRCEAVRLVGSGVLTREGMGVIRLMWADIFQMRLPSSFPKDVVCSAPL